ncbi:MAG: polyprenyl synthetase family protein [Syntrophaceae bacterium]|nr:polyprenyl synthetase family protein [Syntrophaceae bacterium]
MEEFHSQSESMRAALNNEMRTILKADGEMPDCLHGMIHYHMGWRAPDLGITNVNTGKRIRPMLLMLVCQASGGDWKQAVPAAAAVELLHNFTLIHDDIEDTNPTRRGRDTLWKIWGIAQAINTGDAIFALAHIALMRLAERGLPAERVLRAIRRFDETGVSLAKGQHADLCFERQEMISVDDYMEMITMKTAVLPSLCAELGAIIAGADDDTVDLYRQFGLNFGLAYQIIDDILGIWGDESFTGKPVSTDIVSGKKTLPILYGLEKSIELRELYRKNEKDDDFIRKVVILLNQTGARKFSTEKAAAYSRSAVSCLEAARPEGPARAALNQLADTLLNRNY